MTGIKFDYGTYGHVKYDEKTNTVKNVQISESSLESMREIRHPNIVPYYGICRLSPSIETVINMQRMNVNLNQYMQNTLDISLNEKLQILNDVILGLRFLHAQQPSIIHADLVARNILLHSKGMAKVRLRNARIRSMPLILTSEIPLAMPPEALEEGYQCSEELDVFLFGNLSIHVLLQKRPILKHTYEVERSKVYLHDLKLQLDQHPFYSVVISCLNNEPCKRPPCKDINVLD